MIRIEFTGNAHELLTEIRNFLGLRGKLAIGPALETAIRDMDDADAAAPQPTPADAGGDAPPVAVKRGRGRPRKETAPAEAPKSEAHVPSESAVADNTGSEQPAALPTGDAASAATAEEPTPERASAGAPIITVEEFRDRLQKGSATDDGFRRVVGLLGEFGYAKVKDVKPEHYGAILAKMEAAS